MGIELLLDVPHDLDGLGRSAPDVEVAFACRIGGDHNDMIGKGEQSVAEGGELLLRIRGQETRAEEQRP